MGLPPKIASVVGARPQFIKAALLCRKLRNKGLREVLVHTGQHYDFGLYGIFFEELDLPTPDYSLGVGSGSHGEQTGKMLVELERVFVGEKPEMVLVYGDTNSTLAGALAAAKLGIPVAHVEAGLRSYNRRMPEEINRVITDHISSLLFCPTDASVDNLRSEGFVNILNQGKLLAYPPSELPNGRLKTPAVMNVGDVMFDLATKMEKLTHKEQLLWKYKLQPKNYVLVTIHRAENTDCNENLGEIWDALLHIAGSEKTVFFPIHPRAWNALDRLALLRAELPRGLRLSGPISYKEMLALESRDRVIITDSGGVQKEGYFFKTPCVIPRKETEWVELVESGWNVLTGADRDRIAKETMNLWNNGVRKEWQNFYGDEKASNRISEVLKRFLRGR